MTLLIRLLMVGLLGLGLFFGYIKWGEPTLRAMQAEEQHGPASGTVPREISTRAARSMRTSNTSASC